MAITRTISDVSGDGQLAPLVMFTLGLPGPADTTVQITGTVQAVGGTAVSITGSPLVGPTVPGAGSTFWIIQVNTTTGAASIKTSAVSLPAPDASNVQIYSDVLASTDANIAADATSATADTW